MNLRFEHLVVFTFCWFHEIDAFVPSKLPCKVTSRRGLHSLSAKKKRRRKQNNNSANSSEIPSTQVGNQGRDLNELPDFDIEPSKANLETQDRSETGRFSAASSVALDGSKITKAQMGTAKPLASLNDLLNDRSLEKEMMFLDEPTEGDELPSFASYLERAAGDPEQVMGKKRARRAERRAAAIEAKQEEEKNINILSKVPFIGIEEDEELTPLKVSTNVSIQ